MRGFLDFANLFCEEYRCEQPERYTAASVTKSVSVVRDDMLSADFQNSLIAKTSNRSVRSSIA